MNKQERLGFFGALAAVTAWGANSVILKFLTGSMSVALLNASRILVAGVVFMAIFAFLRHGKGLPKLPSRVWILIFVAGLVGTSLYQFLFANGIKFTNASITALISSTNPIWVGLLGVLVGQRLGQNQLIGVPVTMLGVALLSYSNIVGANVAPLGVALLIASNFCWAVYTVMSRQLMKHISPLEFTCISFALGGLPFVLLSLPAWTDTSTITPNIWAWVVLSALVAQVIGFIGWFMGTQALGAARVSIFLNVTPLVGVGLAASFLGEKITLEKMLAGAIILFGVWLASRNPV
ncbi:MAG: DMT family transporter [Deinococcales bacterium]